MLASSAVFHMISGKVVILNTLSTPNTPNPENNGPWSCVLGNPGLL